MEETIEKRRKYIGVGGNDVPSLGVLEGDILRLIWDAGEPQTSVQVYELMHFSRRAAKEEMLSPSTIAVTLSRMVEKGMLTVERRPRGGKGYYGAVKSRAEVVAETLNDVSKRLTGQPLGYVLTRLNAPKGAKVPPIVTKETGEVASVDAGLEQLIGALRKLQTEDNTPIPFKTELY